MQRVGWSHILCTGLRDAHPIVHPRQERRLVVDALSSCNIRWGGPTTKQHEDQGTHHVLPTTSTAAEHSGQGNTHPMTVLSFQSCRVSIESVGYLLFSIKSSHSQPPLEAGKSHFAPGPLPYVQHALHDTFMVRYIASSEHEVIEKANSLQSPANAATSSFTKGRTYAWTGRGRRRGRRKQQT